MLVYEPHMKNILIMTALLGGGFGVALLCGAPIPEAGRIGLALLFAFTSLGHFVKREEMSAMLPSRIRGKALIVFASGILEAAFAICLTIPYLAQPIGVAICAFLVLVAPINIYSALKRVEFGGHSAGPVYLLARIPFQALLIAGTYVSAVRG